MLITYHRVFRVSPLSALAAVASAVVVVGVATTVLVAVGVAAGGVRLLRAIRLIGPAGRRVAFEDHTTIEGVVVNSTDELDQPRRIGGDRG